MKYIVVGLGNPGEEYENTRHNTGRDAVLHFAKKTEFGEWEPDRKSKSIIAEGKIGKVKVTVVLPETFMNNSGKAVKNFVSSIKKPESLIVVHDDMDLPIGSYKISFNKSAGGHRGVDSIIKAVKSQEFMRIRIGVSPAKGKGVKKPQGEKAVVDFILGKYKKPEMEKIKGVFKQAAEAISNLITEGKDKTMSGFHRK